MEGILNYFIPILENSRQIKKADKGQRSYFSGNMAGERKFDIVYKETFLNKLDLDIMIQFLKDYIRDLKLASSNNEKKDIEFSLRNLEVFIRDYIKINIPIPKEDISYSFKKMIESR